MRLDDILFSQGLGSRRECAGLLAARLVRIAGRIETNPAADLATNGLQFEVEGQTWTFQDASLVLLHKPAGYECSQKPTAWPSVMLLLPAALRRRGVQPVGRLDQDTTGLLLLTDDGKLIHRLTSPKHHVPKIDEVGCDRKRGGDGGRRGRRRDGKGGGGGARVTTAMVVARRLRRRGWRRVSVEYGWRW